MKAERNPEPMASEEKARRVARILDDLKADDVVALDLRGLTDLADLFVIATARSRAQKNAMAARVEEGMRAAGVRLFAPVEDESDRWTILDYGDIVVHLFDEEARGLYRLESIWGDAPQLDLAPDRPGTPTEAGARAL